MKVTVLLSPLLHPDELKLAATIATTTLCANLWWNLCSTHTGSRNFPRVVRRISQVCTANRASLRVCTLCELLFKGFVNQIPRSGVRQSSCSSFNPFMLRLNVLFTRLIRTRFLAVTRRDKTILLAFRVIRLFGPK